ncbi:MAG: MXAN_5808 family serine peptidase [Myxococcota bacterium]
MARLLKHAAFIGLSIPAVVGVLVLSGSSVQESGKIAAGSPFGIGSRSGGDPDHDLQRLAVLERDLYIIKQRYVEKDRLDPDAMFEGALDMVERQIPEVMFIRKPGGDKLHVSVGAYSTIIPLEQIDDLDDLYSQLSHVVEILDNNLSDEVERAGVEYALINGALSTLDPHSMLLPPVAAKEMEVDNQGEFGGLGIEIVNEDGRLTVQNPIPDTPAAKAGLKTDDHIIRIEDVSTINMDLSEAVERLRGEVGSPIRIQVMRKGLNRPLDFTLTRAVIRINPVEGELLEGDVGYIRIKAFHANVASDLDDLLSRFGRESSGRLRGLILDMRSNPGGYLNQAIEVVDRFQREGVIVSTVEGGDRRRDESRANDDGNEPDYPIAVLVNASSASASEIVAGALSNTRRAVIIGERTFGKGSVQHLYNHQDSSRLKLTVAQYLTPGDQSIQSVGITPDIQLTPSVVRPPDADDPDSGPMVSLYWREWLDREADLDRHLDHSSARYRADSPFQVRYLRANDEDRTETDPNQDWEVQFSREILLAAPSARRVEVLQAAAPIISRYQNSQAMNLQDAFRALDIDWSPGQNPESLAVDVRLDFGEDGVIRAGEMESLAVEVTNNSDAPIYQLSASIDSENPALDRREFYFGRIDPGQTRRFAQPVMLPLGYGDELAPLSLNFRDPEQRSLLTTNHQMRVEGEPLPTLSYSMTFIDDGSGNSRGDGDGLPDPGEIIDVEVTITNEAGGDTREAFARLKNRSGAGLDLHNGIIEAGEIQTLKGQDCEINTLGCHRILHPGESFTERFSFELRDLPDSGQWDLELLVGDNRAYDYTTISRGGFYDYRRLTERLVLTPETVPSNTARRAPVIEVSRKADLLSPDEQAVMSGVVRDDRGVRDVIIFHDEQKVFFRGGNEGGKELPFTVEEELTPGVNHFYILARDYQGLSTTLAVRSWYDESETDQPLAAKPEGREE